MMKKKILIVANSLEGGGAENILKVILNHIDRVKYDVVVYSLHEPGTITKLPADLKYNFIYKRKAKSVFKRICNEFYNRYKSLIYDYFTSKTFYRLFIRGKFDTEIAFIEGYATRIVAGSTNQKSKKLAWLHTDMYDNHWSKIAFKSSSEEEQMYKCFDEIVAVSQGVAKSLKRLYSDITTPTVVYNPINDNDIRKKAKAYTPDIKHDDSKLLVSIGRLVPEKGYDRLIRVIKLLKEENCKLHLYIVGAGTEKDNLQLIIDELDLKNEITLVGHKENPYPYLISADAFVCSSRCEGFSTVITEALVLGVPVVTTDCAGMDDLLGYDSKYGLIVENNESGLLNGIKSILIPEINKKYKRMSQIRGRDFELSKLMKIFESKL